VRSLLVLLACSGALSLGVAAADATQPRLTVPSSVVAEATGPSGAVVSFDVQAQNPGGTVDVACSPASGSVFPLGTTKVVCTATDPADGSSATASFPVVVRDTTGPDFGPPPDRVTQTVDGAASTEVDYVEPAANDLVDGDVLVTCTPSSGAAFPLGDTTVTCRAKDKRGNTSSVTFTVSVVDDVPPPPVTTFKATLLRIGVSLTWLRPASTDVVRVELSRMPGAAGAAQSVLYHGTAHTFLDRTIQPGKKYTYAVVTVDRAGNQSSRAVRAVSVPVPAPKKTPPKKPPPSPEQQKPATPSLFSPADGARVASPPLLRWHPVAGAAYYNVQIYRAGSKVLSTWPRESHLRLQAAWLYNGHQFHLKPGTYQWYVWPGFGALAQAKYGKRILQATFVVRQA
jgi:HYR domain